MRKFQTYLLIICFLGLIPMCSSAVTSGIFARFTETIPGNAYDLGTLVSTDIIRVNLTWTFIADFGSSPNIVPYIMSGGIRSSLTVDPRNIKSLGATNRIYEAPAGQNAQIYIVIEFKDFGAADYNVEIFVNGQLVKTDDSTVFANNHMPSSKFSVVNTC